MDGLLEPVIPLNHEPEAPRGVSLRDLCFPSDVAMSVSSFRPNGVRRSQDRDWRVPHSLATPTIRLFNTGIGAHVVQEDCYNPIGVNGGAAKVTCLAERKMRTFGLHAKSIREIFGETRGTTPLFQEEMNIATDAAS